MRVATYLNVANLLGFICIFNVRALLRIPCNRRGHFDRSRPAFEIKVSFCYARFALNVFLKVSLLNTARAMIEADNREQPSGSRTL
jgi:hypothetical protein